MPSTAGANARAPAERAAPPSSRVRRTGPAPGRDPSSPSPRPAGRPPPAAPARIARGLAAAGPTRPRGPAATTAPAGNSPPAAPDSEPGRPPAARENVPERPPADGPPATGAEPPGPGRDEPVGISATMSAGAATRGRSASWP